MYSLERTLIDREIDLLHALAALWDIDLAPDQTQPQIVEHLALKMVEPHAINAVLARLSETENEALVALQTHDGRLPLAQFMRQFGEVRPMGVARRERDQPWLQPANPTEALYYRGLIARAFSQGPGGAQEYIYIPTDLLAALPLPASASARPAPGQPAQDVTREDTLLASQTAPDDLTTLLAYLRLHEYPVKAPDAANMAQLSIATLEPYLLNRAPAFQPLLASLAHDLGLVDAADSLHPVADAARPWLQAPRQHQLRSLAEAWRDTVMWNDLRHVPGLQADQWPNDPLATRQTILSLMSRVPPGEWWSLDSFVAALKADTPDFQRPGGDYHNWYIQDASTSEVLHGFENWDRIDGALVHWLVSGPMHWLGLLDLNPESDAFRLTPLAAALLDLTIWPSDPDAEAQLSIDSESLITVPPTLSRYDRYQIARFAAWRDIPEASSPLYTYQLTPQSLERAANQGITIGHIMSFFKRIKIAPFPPSVRKALTAWDEEGAQVVLHDVVVLVAKDFGVHERLKSEHSVSRWLGNSLGPNTYAVARRDVPALIAALRRLGLLPFFEGLDEDEAP